MPFKNYPCWKNNMVSQVMNTEALDMPDHLFLATHHPIKMYRIDLLNDEKGLEYDEESLLRDFMATPDYNFITILGESGTGKSHLVRWLSANIPAVPGRRVLLIRKARTNLKEIIKSILKNLDGPKFDDYRRRLIENTDTISHEQARLKLLLSLIEVVGPYYERSEKITEEQDFIMRGLPDMLSDPFFQRKLLEDGGILHKLTIHIMGDSEKIERLEERRQFKLDDLPLNVRDIGKAGHHAKDFYSAIVADDDLKKLTVDWINHNLDAAIAQVLTFRGQDLFNLMIEVRETLAEKEQELVLLIEEFAKLQGIEAQMLDALLVKPNQGDAKLCNLRVAIASTTGFFNKLPETVKTRITFRVNLDVNKEGAEKIISNDDILEFTARYLNTVRLEESALMSWHSSGDVTLGQERDALPCACQDCTHMGECQEAFGASQGMGLYPFNDKAIYNMLRLVSPKQFNPRFYIDKALRYILYNYRDSLASGQFPPIALLRHFGPASMTAILQAELKKKDPKNYERRQTLLELWGNPEIICDLNPVIHSSFDLPTLGVSTREGDMPKDEPKVSVPPKLEMPKSETIPDVLKNRIQKLDDWQNQGELNQDLAQYLRELLYFSICSHIDWDAELLLKGQFVGTRKPFQQKGIIFQNQGTLTSGLMDVTLRIPLEGDSINEAALALQGAIYFNHFRHWKFPKGPLYMRAYIRLLEKWSQYILEQVKKTVNEKDDWDPVSSIVEILTISSYMAGMPTKKLEDKIGSLFKKIPLLAGEKRSAKWQSLYKKLASIRMSEEGSTKKGLSEILLSRTACTKGGATPQMVDAGRYIKPLTDLAKSCRPLIIVPNTLKASYSNIFSASDIIKKSLSDAINDEVERCKNWLENVHLTFGQNPVKAEIVKEIKETIELAIKEGVFGGSKDKEKLILSLENFGRVSFTGAINNTNRVIELQDEGALLKLLGCLDDKAMSVTDDFIQDVEKFIIATTEKIDDNIKNWESIDNPDEISKKIQQNFKDLDSLLKAM